MIAKYALCCQLKSVLFSGGILVGRGRMNEAGKAAPEPQHPTCLFTKTLKHSAVWLGFSYHNN